MSSIHLKGKRQMRANHVKRRLAAGEPSVGTWLSLPSPEAAEFVSRLGFDWLVVDTEHNPTDIRTLSLMFGAITTGGSAPMVRIPWNHPENFKRVLDAGAWGIVVPMVNSREEAERAAEATFFPPRGKRSVGGSMTGTRFETSGGDYLKHADDETCLILQIEHIDAVERCDEILSVPGVAGCFIGPNDLAASMRSPDGKNPPKEKLEEAIQEILAASKRQGVPCGIHVFSSADALLRAEQGFQFIAVNSELKMMLESASALVSAVNPGDEREGLARY